MAIYRSKDFASMAALNQRRLPNCIIIGAAKSGTTSLWRYLQQHPDVYMHPQKRLNFMALEGKMFEFAGPPPRDMSVLSVTTFDDYLKAFAGASNESVLGEASNLYLYSHSAASNIRRLLPDAKLIVILRNPVDRAYSRFLQLVRSGREHITDFSEALSAEEHRIQSHWWPDFHYANMGFYYSQLKTYFDVFNRDNIRIYLYEDLLRDPRALAADLYEYVGVDPGYVPETNIKYSASGLPRSANLHRTLQELRHLRPLADRFLSAAARKRIDSIASAIHNRNLTKPTLSVDIRNHMIERFSDDMDDLEKLIGRDLSTWRKPDLQ